MSRARALLFAGIVSIGVALAGVAFAFWSSSDAGAPARASADAIGAGNAPVVGAPTGASVVLSWAATTTSGGAAVSGYTVARYSQASSGTPTAATGGCAGTVAAVTCTEQSVPDGLWYYAITPKISLWTGAQSARSAVRVDTTAPVTTDNSASIGSAWVSTATTLTLTPSDAGSGVAATYSTSDGATPTTASTSGTEVLLASDGVYAVKYFSVDAYGNIESVKTAGTTISIDMTAPTPATFSLPSAIGAGQSLTDAATDATVNGASSGVASVAYYYCAGAGCTPNTLIGTSSTGASYAKTWSSQPADGTYRVAAVVTDVAGNTAMSNIVSTVVDNSAPTGGSLGYSNGYPAGGSVTVTFSTGSDPAGIDTATAQLQRSSATLSNGACGTFGSFAVVGGAAPNSPYTDTTVVSGNCYMYRYVVSDSVGNAATYTSASVAKIDTSAPTFTVTRSGANVYATGTAVFFKTAGSGSFTVTAVDNESGITASTFPSAPAGWTVSGSGNARTYTLGLATVTSSIVVSTTNSASMASGNVTVTITPDITAPIVTGGVAAPIDNTTTAGFVKAGGQYYVYVAGSDAGSGVASVLVNVNSITAGQTAVPLVSGTFAGFGTTYNWRSAALTADTGISGTKTETGTLTDNVGNTLLPGSGSVTVDNTAPTGSITAPSNGYAGAATTVTANSADASAGVLTATLQYRATGAGAWTTIAVDTASPYSSTWDTSALAEGSYDLQVVTVDNASNAFTSSTVVVTVDHHAPATPAAPVLAGASDTGIVGDNITKTATPTFTGSAETGATVTLFDGVTPVGSATAAGGAYSVTASTLTTGAHTLTVIATDPAGNASTASSGVTVTIDTTVPTPSDVTLSNATGSTKKMDAGDRVAILYSEAMNAASFCSTWVNDGTAQTLTNATLTVTQNSSTDVMTLATPTCTFHLGSVILGDYVSATATFTSSTVAWNPTTKTLTITVGTFATGTLKTNVTAVAPKYTPDAALTDVAGNAMAATQFTDPQATGL